MLKTVTEVSNLQSCYVISKAISTETYYNGMRKIVFLLVDKLYYVFQ